MSVIINPEVTGFTVLREWTGVTVASEATGFTVKQETMGVDATKATTGVTSDPVESWWLYGSGEGVSFGTGEEIEL